MMYKKKPARSKKYREWVFTQGGRCCVCGGKFEEEHHFGDKGTGQRCSDFLICRICKKCHTTYQGKRFIGFEREGQLDVLCLMQRDALNLLSDYLDYLGITKPLEQEEDECF